MSVLSSPSAFGSYPLSIYRPGDTTIRPADSDSIWSRTSSSSTESATESATDDEDSYLTLNVGDNSTDSLSAEEDGNCRNPTEGESIVPVEPLPFDLSDLVDNWSSEGNERQDSREISQDPDYERGVHCCSSCDESNGEQSDNDDVAVPIRRKVLLVGAKLDNIFDDEVDLSDKVRCTSTPLSSPPSVEPANKYYWPLKTIPQQDDPEGREFYRTELGLIDLDLLYPCTRTSPCLLDKFIFEEHLESLEVNGRSVSHIMKNLLAVAARNKRSVNGYARAGV